MITLITSYKSGCPCRNTGATVFQRAVVVRRGAILGKNIKKNKKIFKKPPKIT